MRISELSRRSGVPVATIKYYRREGLLPEGRALNPTTVEYDEEHVQRLRLIRSLIQLGGLSVARTREVLEAVEQPLDAFETLAVIHHALPVPSAETSGKDGEDHEGAADGAASGGAVARVEALIENMGWRISDASPHRPALAESLAALSRLGADYTADDLIPYARLATSTADLDFAQLEGIEDQIALAERAVVLGVLFEPVVRLLRRLAQEDANHRRHDRRACGRGERPAE
ncbi:MerR family transcriptional regulator [Streptomyces ipomoeae]|uniref:MerR family transcriptional regulator n=1 Tax=Streptomyces ipomoeae TaxID=103232 RepID=A0AAE9AZH7_9ACTN|nr:MerR family transcriptional regulator [Streptomyces ipomoeae]MDX2692249.1 MerR family transcriptional regulator [Streptomyces ipomoeae]MDX2819663.1 MerR family transcriptional regulator [Streptomyces ipomoeae]MDX2838792.1 MerR family transcriptional regulator [Streptomyces ipomoeae]MDX2872351.1 MerR family transcriptional regulator [Streptomyces ipomoeae]TQE29966.1 MerR family transcriptional regulator [Streptomyces ipomoeae]